MSGARKNNTGVCRTNRRRRARCAMLSVAVSMSVGAMTSRSLASTFSWTRGGTNNNWTTAANWASPDGGTPPPNAVDADVIFTGTPAAGSVTQNGAFTIHGITITADFNPGANFNVSGSTSVASNLTLGAGGIQSDLLTWQLKFTTNTAGANITLSDAQTWHNVAPAGGAGGTLSVDRTLVGPASATVTKTGNGLLILSRDNSTFLGGFTISDGTIRLQGSSHAFGAGTLTINTDNTVGITASTDLPQIIDGPIVLGGGGTASFGGSFAFTWNGAVNLLNDKVVTNGPNNPIIANAAFTGARYIKQGSGTLTLNAANGNAGFTIRGGYVPVGDDSRLGAPGAALGLGGVDNGAGTITTGTLLLTAPLLTSRNVALDNIGGNIDDAGFGSSFANVVGDGTSTTGALNKYGSGTMSVASIRAGTLNIAGGAVSVSPLGTGAATSRIGTVLLADGGSGPTTVLDLNDNDLIVTAGSVSAVESAIGNARHGGAWDQPGITSSSAANNANHSTTLGVLSGADYTSVAGGTFDGLAVASSDVLVKYTWYGDTDFNGVVNFDDYVRTDNGFNNHLSGWLNGDFDGNGAVNFDDYVLIDLAFNTQSGTLGQAIAFLSDPSTAGLTSPALQKLQEHYSEFGGAYASAFLSAVPEPATTTLICVLASAGMFRPRRVGRRVI